jgi:hypothetical protein
MSDFCPIADIGARPLPTRSGHLALLNADVQIADIQFLANEPICKAPSGAERRESRSRFSEIFFHF